PLRLYSLVINCITEGEHFSDEKRIFSREKWMDIENFLQSTPLQQILFIKSVIPNLKKDWLLNE
ncbi:MAG TPA: hypothetical protein VLM88_03030, partial [Proteiniclasticum sp.]|nr:hypothetical protein [Proteiniclasticum sp.]